MLPVAPGGAVRNGRRAKPSSVGDGGGGGKQKEAQLDCRVITHGELTRSRGESDLMQGEEVP